MEYIVSRGYEIDEQVLKENVFYQVWSKKLFPYKNLKVDDIIYWYDRKLNKINYKTEVAKIARFEFSNRKALLDGINKFFGHVQGEDYLKTKGNIGYCMCYRIKNPKKVSFYRPAGVRLPQFGWLEVNEEIKEEWLNADQFKVADDAVLSRLANKDLIRKVKEKVGYRCQFPGCGVRIKTKNGYYAEAAHIVAVRDGGVTDAGNLVVLCPNHHKEFDHGELSIVRCTKKKVEGVLNGKKFEINFK